MKGINIIEDHEYSTWWLRSPGESQDRAAVVFDNGKLYKEGEQVQYPYYDSAGVRPAFWLDLTSDIVTSETP